MLFTPALHGTGESVVIGSFLTPMCNVCDATTLLESAKVNFV